MTQALKMATVGGAAAPTYVDDVFSTYLYAGNGSTQTINNGIDLAVKGGLVWLKGRGDATGHRLTDTARGATKSLESNSTGAETTESTGLTSFGSSGFSIGDDAEYNTSGPTYVAWTFRKAPKFFDVVTYTGDGSNRTIAHALGIEPGCIIVKRIDAPSDWSVYHRSLANTAYARLVSSGPATDVTRWNSTTATSSEFSLGTNINVNESGGTYVAYLFAHNEASDGLIQCGSFTTDGSGNASVTLGWEPQYVLIKSTNGTSSWTLVDSLRGMPVGNNVQRLFINSASAESTGIASSPTAVGFTEALGVSANRPYIYIAIRRPNKPPTVGTEVFAPVTSTNDTLQITTGFVVDMFLEMERTTTNAWYFDRLRNKDARLASASAAAETNTASSQQIDSNTSVTPYQWGSPNPVVVEAFRRAPGFFDVVCDTGTGSAHAIAHNLAAAPELILRKGRSGATDWQVYSANLANTQKLVLNSTAAVSTDTAAWNSTTPTSSVFTVGTGANVNTNASTYVTYLFATLAGISKVGAYTGNGSSQTINCGFTTGARFVLIKRTDSTGDWFVWDTARGIVSGNDPHLSLNSTAAEVTTDDSIDPATSGFIVNQVSGIDINVNAATYIYLAIA